eukprot:TRINITY_DN12806_c0_g1_i1.p1 TRINITY_DN12806_c0_g1~~TRINITY_DN12806_c0_g1_i1.p1  ORF type:complete len:351 (-),score=99.48 TRINITY_DN12806_c0_g1_i1:26-1078(-)
MYKRRKAFRDLTNIKREPLDQNVPIQIKKEPLNSDIRVEPRDIAIKIEQGSDGPKVKIETKHLEIEYDDDTKNIQSHPTEELFRTAYNLFCGYYGKPIRVFEGNSTSACGRKEGVTEAVISVILSQNTSNRNSSRAMKSLFEKFPKGADQVRTATASQIEDAIRSGGLAKTKSERIHKFLSDLYEEQGNVSLEHLREKETPEIKQFLSRFKGLGPKTISCVLLFTLNRPDFAVDTHVHRVTNRLGWVHEKAREKTYIKLNEEIPDDLKYDLHVLLIQHGREICKSQQPRCGSCPVLSVCEFGQNMATSEIKDESEDEEKPKKKKRKSAPKKTRKVKTEPDDNDMEELQFA